MAGGKGHIFIAVTPAASSQGGNEPGRERGRGGEGQVKLGGGMVNRSGYARIVAWPGGKRRSGSVKNTLGAHSSQGCPDRCWL